MVLVKGEKTVTNGPERKIRPRSRSICFCLSLFRFFHHHLFSFFGFPQRTNSFRPETELSGICLSVVNGSSKFSRAKKRGWKKKVREKEFGKKEQWENVKFVKGATLNIRRKEKIRTCILCVYIKFPC